MRRGEVWTVSGGKDYAGKPRPVVIVQDDVFDATDSVTICAFTTDPTEAPLFRLPVESNAPTEHICIREFLVDCLRIQAAALRTNISIIVNVEAIIGQDFRHGRVHVLRGRYRVTDLIGLAYSIAASHAFRCIVGRTSKLSDTGG